MPEDEKINCWQCGQVNFLWRGHWRIKQVILELFIEGATILSKCGLPINKCQMLADVCHFGYLLLH